MAIKGVRCAGMMLWAGLLGFLLVAALGLSTASGAVSPAPSRRCSRSGSGPDARGRRALWPRREAVALGGMPPSA